RVVVQSFLEMGIDLLTGGKKAFFNVSREFLLQDDIRMFPPGITGLEIRGDIDPAPDLIAACGRLREDGYTIALDHFVLSDKVQPLVDLADLVKVDFLATSDVVKRSLAKPLQSRGIQLVAEKIETTGALHLAREFGSTHVQGYFFRKPVMVREKDIPVSNLDYLQMTQEIHKPDLDFDQIERVIKQDVSLSYKLLRYVNSAFFGWRQEIRSIKHALALIGEKEVKKWTSLVALASMGDDKPSELIVGAIVRARFCEAMAHRAGMADRSQELFLMGMFSMLDALLDRPLRD
ncbi:MAG: HDOD domain-containing protein, partial [Nitrospirae bacterium]|nr:HDOD domain-containing protein [Nitrospirota bacterium]